MRIPRPLVSILFALLALPVALATGHPGDHGLVQLTIRDADGGQALGFANVVVLRPDSTTFTGTMADGEGHAELRLPAPGEYILRVLMMGYARHHEAVQLAVGDSLQLDIGLQPTVVKQFDVFRIEGKAVEVVVRDTGFGPAIGQEDLTDYAVDTVEEAVRRQAGGLSRNGELHVRGGRSGRIKFRIDGEREEEVADTLPEGFDSYIPPASGQGQSPTRRGPTPAERVLAALGDAGELWVLEEASGPVRPAGGDELPGTGAMMARLDSAGHEVPLPLAHTAVRASVDGFLSGVSLTQRFENPFEDRIHARYLFPLPHDAAVDGFVLRVGDRRVVGVVREKEEARELYEQAKRRGHVASLLEQHRPNLFEQEVANLEPGAHIEVDIHFLHALEYQDGWYEFVFPMVVAPRFHPPGQPDPIVAISRTAPQPPAPCDAVRYLAPGERSGHDIALSLRLDPGVDIEELECESHAIAVERPSAGVAQVSLAGGETIPNRDFVLRFRVAGSRIKSRLLVDRRPGAAGGHFALMLYPPGGIDALPRVPVEMVFVLDGSGSMSGWPIETAKGAIRRAMGQLQPQDSFQLIRFSNDRSQLGPAPLPATPENLQRGLAYLDQLHGSGGTMMIRGIEAALDFPHDPGRLRVVSFLTDGHIGNELQILAAVEEKLGAARLFSFGVGSSPNRYLLEGMARLGRGAVAWINGEGDAEVVDRFYERMRHAALQDVELDWNGLEVSGLSHRTLPDLVVGRALLLTGRFEGDLPSSVRVRGRSARGMVSLEVPVDREHTDRAELATLWARQELRRLEDERRRAADPEPVDERLLALALEHQIVSRLSSFLAVDEAEITAGEAARLVPMAVPVPAGMRYDTTVAGGDDEP